MRPRARKSERFAAALGLLMLACSSSSKTIATDSCSPGELTRCELASGCEARKTCGPDGKTYGPCQCIGVDGGGTTGGGSSGRGGSGATSGGTGPAGSAGGPAGAAGVPVGGAAGVPAGGAAGVPAGGNAGGPGGSAGGPAGSAGIGLPDGSAGGPVGGAAGAPLDSGMAGSGSMLDGPALCLKCMRAMEVGANPSDPTICAASRSTYTAMYNCVCMASSVCAPPCGAHCANPSGNPFSQNCQSCVLASCPNVITACINDT